MNDQPVKRRGGRKKGTPNKVTAEIRALASQYTEAALEALVEILATGQSEAARVAAAREILDRAHGKSTAAAESAPGKKEQRRSAADEAAAGKFAVPVAPKLVVNNRR